jgi:polyferredoxin
MPNENVKMCICNTSIKMCYKVIRYLEYLPKGSTQFSFVAKNMRKSYKSRRSKIAGNGFLTKFNSHATTIRSGNWAGTQYVSEKRRMRNKQ